MGLQDHGRSVQSENENRGITNPSYFEVNANIFHQANSHSKGGTLSVNFWASLNLTLDKLMEETGRWLSHENMELWLS